MLNGGTAKCYYNRTRNAAAAGANLAPAYETKPWLRTPHAIMQILNSLELNTKFFSPKQILLSFSANFFTLSHRWYRAAGRVVRAFAGAKLRRVYMGLYAAFLINFCRSGFSCAGSSWRFKNINVHQVTLI